MIGSRPVAPADRGDAREAKRPRRVSNAASCAGAAPRWRAAFGPKRDVPATLKAAPSPHGGP